MLGTRSGYRSGYGPFGSEAPSEEAGQPEHDPGLDRAIEVNGMARIIAGMAW
jgi:hypothetical protein